MMSTLILHTPELDAEARALLRRSLGAEAEACSGHYRLHFAGTLPGETLAALRGQLPFDLNPVPARLRTDAVRLLITDMDSTLINIECIDEIADFIGRKAEVAAITEEAMRGEIDFRTSLTRRVALLEGLEESALLRVYEERLRLNPGAEAMVRGLQQRGAAVALVSGGFTFFTERLHARLGLDHTLANRLEVREGRLTGRVLGEIVDAEGKAALLARLCAEKGIAPEQTIAMGDGANDLKMLAAAGLGIAYRAKPKVQAQADAVFNHAPLDAVLHFLA